MAIEKFFIVVGSTIKKFQHHRAWSLYLVAIEKKKFQHHRAWSLYLVAIEKKRKKLLYLVATKKNLVVVPCGD